MSSQRDGGVDDATQAAPEGEDKNTGQETSLVSALLKNARDMGHLIGEPKLEQQSEPEEEASTESEVSSSESEGETEAEVFPESTEEVAESEEQEETTEPEEETEAPAAESKTSIEDQIEKLEAEGKKVPWYLPRIAKETRLKNERTNERNEAARIASEWKQRAEALETQLAEASGRAPSTQDPLANVFSFQRLEERKQEAEKWVAWAERNRSGGEAVIGKDKDGGDITEYLDEEKVTNLKLGCDKVLREGIPQRRAYIQAKSDMDAKAVEIYPDLKNRESLLYREAMEIVRALQAGYLPPDFMIWIGHAIKGRNDYIASLNGNGSGPPKKPSAAKKIVASAKTSIAPTATKTRGVIPRSGRGDVESARKELAIKGNAESAVKLLERLGVGGGGRSRRAELIEK